MVNQLAWYPIAMMHSKQVLNQFQNFVHEVIDSPRTKGWGNQIGNELTGEVICESKWKLFQSQRR
jgi:hypothetical protein